MGIDGMMKMHIYCKEKCTQEKIFKVLNAIRSSFEYDFERDFTEINKSDLGGAKVVSIKLGDRSFFTERFVLPLLMDMKEVKTESEIYANDMFNIINARGITEEQYLTELSEKHNIDIEWWSVHDSNMSEKNHLTLCNGNINFVTMSIFSEIAVEEGKATEEQKKEVEKFRLEGEYGSATLSRALIEI